MGIFAAKKLMKKRKKFRWSQRTYKVRTKLANRNVGAFVLTATLVASLVGGNSIVSTMAFVYQYGISVLWAPIGTLLGFLVLTLYVRWLHLNFFLFFINFLAAKIPILSSIKVDF
jgi:Na+/pantothenate symporter